MSNPTNAPGSSDGSSIEPRYAADELQPESAINELSALTELEDGTNRGGQLPMDIKGGTPSDAVAIVQLTADERQPVDAIAEYQALSEREDGTNIG